MIAMRGLCMAQAPNNNILITAPRLLGGADDIISAATIASMDFVAVPGSTIGRFHEAISLSL